MTDSLWNPCVQNDFFSDENGSRIGHDTPYDRPINVIGTILDRTQTTESDHSRQTISAEDLSSSMSLQTLIRLTDNHQSLQRAEICLAEGYKITTRGVLHRFIVLEIRRPDQKSIWLRLDRRTDPNVGPLGFILASGVTASNDTVCCHLLTDVTT